MSVSFSPAVDGRAAGCVLYVDGVEKLVSSFCGVGAGDIGAGSFAGVVCSFQIAISRTPIVVTNAAGSVAGGNACHEGYHTLRHYGTTPGNFTVSRVLPKERRKIAAVPREPREGMVKGALKPEAEE